MNVADDRPDSAEVRVLSIDDEHYPPLLRAIHDPPEKLYTLGDVSVLGQPQLAIVGSRRASPAGLRAARMLASGLVRAGLHVCSGLARGIDGAAHEGALTGGGRSVGVMATGIDQVYPARHRALAEEMLRSGCLVTEYPPGTPPRRGHFPRRNRLISGLSLGVLVVEAALPSGSLITAGTAAEQGREVFALPWSIFHPGGGGCLHLIRDGAKMVQTLEDILEELGPLYTLQQELFPRIEGEDAALPVLDAAARQVFDLVGSEACSVDELARCSGQPVPELLGRLSELEIAGLVQRCDGGYTRCE